MSPAEGAQRAQYLCHKNLRQVRLIQLEPPRMTGARQLPRYSNPSRQQDFVEWVEEGQLEGPDGWVEWVRLKGELNEAGDQPT
jgi:hypothetical protein